MLTILKGLPLSYFKDLQDDKEIVFRSFDTLNNCISILNEVLNNFGQSDITYSLSFKLVEKILKKFNLKIGGMTNQKDFLTSLGILNSAAIISKNLPFSTKADIYFRVKRLIDKNFMGELFKVMFITKKNIKFKIGF